MDVVFLLYRQFLIDSIKQLKDVFFNPFNHDLVESSLILLKAIIASVSITLMIFIIDFIIYFPGLLFKRYVVKQSKLVRNVYGFIVLFVYIPATTSLVISLINSLPGYLLKYIVVFASMIILPLFDWYHDKGNFRFWYKVKK